MLGLILTDISGQIFLDDRDRYTRDSWTAAMRGAYGLAHVRAVPIFQPGRAN